jgi:hypothetical protein
LLVEAQVELRTLSIFGHKGVPPHVFKLGNRFEFLASHEGRFTSYYTFPQTPVSEPVKNRKNHFSLRGIEPLLLARPCRSSSIEADIT